MRIIPGLRAVSHPARRTASPHPTARLTAEPTERTVPTERSEAESLVDAALYRAGQRVATPTSLAQTYAQLQDAPGALAWIGLHQPSTATVGALCEHFGLHELLVEDVVQAHQRPKLERYDSTLLAVLHPACYLDAQEEVEFGELHVIVGQDYVVTIQHGKTPDLSAVRARLEAEPDLLATGPEAILYAVMDAVVDQYAPVYRGLDVDIDEIELQVFRGDTEVSRRIYELSQEVADFGRAVRSTQRILSDLSAGFAKYRVTPDLQSYLRDVADHLTEVRERTDGFHSSLRDILTVNATLVAQRQNAEMKTLAEQSRAENEQMRRISAWAAIIFTPSLITGIYGMNFDTMPELHWLLGYPFALGMMVVSGGILYSLFKRKGWL
ncbi:MAG: magnesium and cobalt transport protein CorA [Micrococcales bacterium]|nr:magnesium and cobalt transport protein CorA [Micrococcales bacterium]